jgi:hypothetical protein
MPSKASGEATALTFATPDPAATGEAGVAYIASIVGAIITLFKLNLSEAQQGAAVVLIVAALSIGILVHGAIVRKGRATGNASRG